MTYGLFASNTCHNVDILIIYLSAMKPNFHTFKWCNVYITIKFKVVTIELP